MFGSSGQGSGGSLAALATNKSIYSKYFSQLIIQSIQKCHQDIRLPQKLFKQQVDNINQIYNIHHLYDYLVFFQLLQMIRVERVYFANQFARKANYLSLIIRGENENFFLQSYLDCYLLALNITEQDKKAFNILADTFQQQSIKEMLQAQKEDYSQKLLWKILLVQLRTNFDGESSIDKSFNDIGEFIDCHELPFLLQFDVLLNIFQYIKLPRIVQKTTRRKIFSTYQMILDLIQRNAIFKTYQKKSVTSLKRKYLLELFKNLNSFLQAQRLNHLQSTTLIIKLNQTKSLCYQDPELQELLQEAIVALSSQDIYFTPIYFQLIDFFDINQYNFKIMNKQSVLAGHSNTEVSVLQQEESDDAFTFKLMMSHIKRNIAQQEQHSYNQYKFIRNLLLQSRFLNNNRNNFTLTDFNVILKFFELNNNYDNEHNYESEQDIYVRAIYEQILQKLKFKCQHFNILDEELFQLIHNESIKNYNKEEFELCLGILISQFQHYVKSRTVFSKTLAKRFIDILNVVNMKNPNISSLIDIYAQNIRYFSNEEIIIILNFMMKNQLSITDYIKNSFAQIQKNLHLQDGQQCRNLALLAFYYTDELNGVRKYQEVLFTKLFREKLIDSVFIFQMCKIKMQRKLNFNFLLNFLEQYDKPESIITNQLELAAFIISKGIKHEILVYQFNSIKNQQQNQAIKETKSTIQLWCEQNNTILKYEGLKDWEIQFFLQVFPSKNVSSYKLGKSKQIIIKKPK